MNPFPASSSTAPKPKQTRKANKKVFKRNDKQYNRLMDHIGRFPAVIIAPDDSELIQGGSEVRRKFLQSQGAEQAFKPFSLPSSTVSSARPLRCCSFSFFVSEEKRRETKKGERQIAIRTI